VIIDSPRKAIGSSEANRALDGRIYSRITTIAEIYGDKVQPIVADNDLPIDIVRTVRECLIPTRSSPTSADTGPLGQVGSAVNGSVDAGESPARSVPG
jgi:hypothetical protein